MQTIKLTDSFGYNSGITLAMYGGEAGWEFESFTEYLRRVFYPILSADPNLWMIRCSLSGFPIASVYADEAMDTFEAALHVLDVTQEDALLSIPSTERVLDIMEMIYLHIKRRMMLLSRPAPALLMSNKIHLLAHLGRNRQLSVLVNAFLRDLDLLKAKNVADANMAKLQLVFDIADVIQSSDAANTEEGGACLDALIQLDAMYSIQELELNFAEETELRALRANNSISLSDITKLASAMILRRNKEMPVEYPKRWTQRAYTALLAQPDYAMKHSNVLAALANANKPSNAHVQRAMAAAKKASGESKPKAKTSTAEQQRSKAFQNYFTNLMLGGGLGGVKK